MRNINPFVRNLAILALLAVVIVVLNQETALATAGTLLRFAFAIAIAVVAYFAWRDFGHREISSWPTRQAIVFYSAVGLLVVDVGWYMLASLAGRDALAFIAVLAVCVYVGVRTWRDQRSLF
jgi:galactitol-specific phosphotransferase system IIC component